MMSRTALVIGGAGFIGSHLCRRLVQGYGVISLDNYFTGSPQNHVPGVDYRTGHAKDVAQCVPEAPDIVFHLGEYSRVEKSFEEPALVWDLNSVGTFGVLEYCRARPTAKLVYAGSSTKFGDGGLGRDQSPYAWTKAASTELVRNYGAWYGLRHAIGYFYNVYGPGERAGVHGTVIEIFRQQALLGEPLTVVSPGTQKRNFTHVADIVEGLVLLGEQGEGGDYGLGAPDSYSVLEVAAMFARPVTMLPPRRGNRMDADLDVSRAAALGWRALRRLPDYIAGLAGDSVTRPMLGSQP
jgi:UDP-glucose 4-epimerase